MRGQEEDLRAYLDNVLLAYAGTTQPTDEVILKIYRQTQKALYPTAHAPSAVRNKRDRERVKKTRRAIEQCYGWVRQDNEVRAAEAVRQPVQAIDVVAVAENPIRGVVVLKRARHNGTDETFEWESYTPQAESTTVESMADANEAIDRLFSAGKPSLSVLLTHLWHFQHVVDGDTAVRTLRLIVDEKTKATALVVVRSAMSLSTVLQGLR